MKTLFIGHGSPLNAIKENSYTRYLTQLGKELKKPECIMVFSAHWLTRGTFITGNPKPEQIYDFYGFPKELYQVRYQPAGMQNLAEKISQEITEIQVDYNRGIDHAAWAVIKHMYPDQSIPVIEMSLDVELTESAHFQLGKKISALNLDNVLYIGSGNLVHNLYEINFDDAAKPFDWSTETNKWIEDKVNSKNIDELIHAQKYMPNYKKAVPTDDHYLPLFYILAMMKEKMNIEYNEIQNGSISMMSISVE